MTPELLAYQDHGAPLRVVDTVDGAQSDAGSPFRQGRAIDSAFMLEEAVLVEYGSDVYALSRDLKVVLADLGSAAGIVPAHGGVYIMRSAGSGKDARVFTYDFVDGSGRVQQSNLVAPPGSILDGSTGASVVVSSNVTYIGSREWEDFHPIEIGRIAGIVGNRIIAGSERPPDLQVVTVDDVAHELVGRPVVVNLGAIVDLECFGYHRAVAPSQLLFATIARLSLPPPIVFPTFADVESGNFRPPVDPCFIAVIDLASGDVSLSDVPFNGSPSALVWSFDSSHIYTWHNDCLLEVSVPDMTMRTLIAEDAPVPLCDLGHRADL